MRPGAAIINTTSVNADSPSPQLLGYATTKGAIQNFTGGLAQLLAEKAIRVNCVAPGPIWTPLIPSTMPTDKVKNFGSQVPMKRPGQPKELAPVYVMLATDEASYVSGATVAGQSDRSHQSASEDSGGQQRGGSGNFANDPERASEAGRKGGEHSHGGR